MSLSIFAIIIFGMLSTTVSASLNYQTTLMKGTEIFTVDRYDNVRWKTTVNLSTTPSDWFEGDTNFKGAQSKVTIKGWNDITWQFYDVFTTIFMAEYFSSEDIFILLKIMDTAGYSETTINANYTDNYDLWYGLRAVWNFTIKDFEELPSYNDGVMVFENPLDFKTILDDYNNLAADLNGKISIQIAGYNFPILSADEFIWQLALNGLAIAKPQPEYLTNLVDELGCVNVSSSGKSLIVERYGETDYTVEISYGEEGTLSSLLVKDVDGNIIFQIVSTNSEWIFYLILIIIAVCGVGLVVYIIIKKRKPKR
ncbi:MAG: hypothetical protein CEE43_01110 [Promethearchaeota archaeon Loki_b32]|nr:MAG: hypothetical protein CEE43_01110 [Candidatus Lokiarchaeota archaeon Loki_b32]